MRGFIFTLVILAIGFFVLMMVQAYQGESFREISIKSAMQEAAEVALVSERDLSSRVDDTESNYLIIGDFEKKFKEVFKDKVNVAVTGASYSFDYLHGVAGQVKAVKIAVTDDKGVTYKEVFVASKADK